MSQPNEQVTQSIENGRKRLANNIIENPAGGNENTLAAVNFTLKKTLDNLEKRYGHLLKDKENWDCFLAEIFYHAMKKITKIGDTDRKVALMGAWYYSHLNNTIDWSTNANYDSCREYTIPHVLY